MLYLAGGFDTACRPRVRAGKDDGVCTQFFPARGELTDFKVGPVRSHGLEMTLSWPL
jgi:hypothetical protein